MHQNYIINCHDNKLYKSNMQDQEGEIMQTARQSYDQQLEDLKQGLMQRWMEDKVDHCYQKMVLQYLKQMSFKQARAQVLKQIQKMGSNASPCQQMQSLKAQREIIIRILPQIIQNQANLPQVCSYLNQIRKINLKISQTILEYKQGLEKRQLTSQAVHKAFSSYLIQLHTQNFIFSNSFLQKYIPFSSKYDPFFLSPYQRIESEGNIQKLPEQVQNIFKMNISYVYRLIKAKNQLNKFLNLGYPKNIKSNGNINKLPQRQEGEDILKYDKDSRDSDKSVSEATPDSGSKKFQIRRKRRFETIHFDAANQQKQIQTLNLKRRKNTSNYNPRSLDLPLTKQKRENDLSVDNKAKKFRIKQQQPKLNFLGRLKTEGQYQVAEDDDINAFRRKMMVRREKRKKIQIQLTHEKQDLAQQQETAPIKRFDFKRRELLPQLFAKDERSPKYEGQQGQIKENSSSSDDDMMKSRNLEDGSAKKVSKLNLKNIHRNSNIFQRKDRIKLYPIEQLKSKPGGQIQNDMNNEQQYKRNRNQLPSLQRKSYFPLSPQIKQANKESSSSNGELQSSSQQAYTGKKQEQLFRDICQENNQADKIRKDMKKNQNGKESETENKKPLKTLVQSESVKLNDEKKFLDAHIRRNLKETDSEANKGVQKFSINNNQSTIKQENLSGFTASQRARNQSILNEIQKQMEQDKNKKKQIQMKPGQIKLKDLYAFIEKQKINQFQRDQFESGLWKQNINLKHSYLTKFYMNSELTAFGISSPRCDGDYSILYWGTTCPQNVTTFLFQKYLDYLEKFTSLNHIYIGCPGYSEQSFQKSGSGFVRKRKNYQKRVLPYTPFLSLQCSNIYFEQSCGQVSIFFSEQIEQFTFTNSKTLEFIQFCLEEKKGSLPQNGKIYNNLTILEVNQILDKLQIDTYATSEKINIQTCRLFTLKDNCTIKSNYFYVRDGYFIPKGTQVYSKQKGKIMRLQMNKQQYNIYFGKKINNIQTFLSLCLSKPTGPDYFFAFKMFSKQLYGRIKSSKSQDGCYGNWDINFLWQDQLRGTVIKEMPEIENIFGPQNFHVAIFKADKLLFAFQVKSSDFFF